VLAHHAQQRSTDADTGRDAGNAPHQQSYLRTEWRFATGWAAHAAAKRIADTRRVPGDTRPPVSDHTTLDLGLRSTPRRGRCDFSLLLQNAANADVREPSLAPGLIRNDLPMAPRSLSVQASCST
jgi:iron complex outermembrane receptor protein